MMTEQMPFRQPPASIVVVSYNTADYIESCLASLRGLDYPRVEIIVVDNASNDGSPDLIRDNFPGVELVEMPDNRGFAGAASVGLYMAQGEIVATVNPDVTLDPGWMNAVAETLLSQPDIGIVGSKILYPDRRTIQHAGGIVHYPLATTTHIGRGEPDSGQYDHPKTVSFVTGAAIAMRRDVGRSLSFFDDAYYPVYYEDVDLCWRAKAEGLRTLYQPRAVAYHEESVTLDHRAPVYYSYYHANRLRFVVKRYSPEQVMLDFLPAEAERIAGDMAPEDRRASLDLLDNQLSHAHRKPDTSNALISRKRETLSSHVSEVMGNWQVYEKSHPTARKLPRRKGLASRVENLLNRIYVWPMLEKQVEYNASLARSVREISRQLQDLQSRVALQSMLSAGMQSRQNNLTGEIAAELDTLRNRLDKLGS